MKSKKWSVLFAPLLVVLFLFLSPNTVHAVENCSSKGIVVTSGNLGSVFTYGQPVSLNVTLSSSGSPGLSEGSNYYLVSSAEGTAGDTKSTNESVTGGTVVWSNWDHGRPLGDNTLDVPGKHKVTLYKTSNPLGSAECVVGTYTVSVGAIDCAYLKVSKDWNAAPSNGAECYADANTCVESGIFGSNLLVRAKLVNADGSVFTGPVIFTLHGTMNAGNDESVSINSNGQEYVHNAFSPDHQGTYTITVKINGGGSQNPAICTGTFLQKNNCDMCGAENNIAEQLGDPYTAEHYTYRICDQVNSDLDTPEGGNAHERCIECIGGDELGRAGIWTAVGCIPREPDIIVKSLLRLGLGVGGGFALIIVLASGFVLSVSQGEPKRIDEAKQWLTSALVGLLFIIFSVTLLHFIGYTIFQIPGFGG